METKLEESESNLVDGPSSSTAEQTSDVLKFKKRMLQWPNPVEFVNNMYGCHPGEGDGEDDDPDNEYFKKVFSE